MFCNGELNADVRLEILQETKILSAKISVFYSLGTDENQVQPWPIFTLYLFQINSVILFNYFLCLCICKHLCVCVSLFVFLVVGVLHFTMINLHAQLQSYPAFFDVNLNNLKLQVHHTYCNFSKVWKLE